MNWFTKNRWRKQIADSGLCAIPRPLELPEDKRILVLAPHADDEIFGCGGTLALLAQQGCEVCVLVVTDGGGGDPEGRFDGRVVELRRKEVIAALAVMGVHQVRFLSEPDGALRTTADVTARIAALFDECRPDWIFAPSIADYHRDHIGVSFHALDLWSQRGFQERMFLYEIWGVLPATWLVDITDVLEAKAAAIQHYRIPLSYLDYARANLGLAAYRGMFLGNAEEPHYAEAFMELPRSPKYRALIDCLMTSRAYIAACSA